MVRSVPQFPQEPKIMEKKIHLPSSFLWRRKNEHEKLRGGKSPTKNAKILYPILYMGAERSFFLHFLWKAWGSLESCWRESISVSAGNGKMQLLLSKQFKKYAFIRICRMNTCWKFDNFESRFVYRWDAKLIHRKNFQKNLLYMLCVFNLAKQWNALLRISLCSTQIYWKCNGDCVNAAICVLFHVNHYLPLRMRRRCWIFWIWMCSKIVVSSKVHFLCCTLSNLRCKI